MARCTATPPCNYKLNGEVHDPGCPARIGYWDDPELDHLYATETADERAQLAVVLEDLIDRDLLDSDDYADTTPSDVTGSDVEWLAIRRMVRNGDTADTIAAHFTLTTDGEGSPALQLRS